jgi:purine-binding chemotaxis protein CheW
MTSNQTASAPQYLTFTVGGDLYGVSILAVREILDYGEVTRAPRAPRHIRGVMNLRGRVVPLVDLAVRLGFEPSAMTPRTCVVVVEAEIEGERLVAGLVADAVSHVIELGSADIEPPPAFGSSCETELLTGLGRAGQKFVLLLNLERVLHALPAPVLRPSVSAEPATASPAFSM